MGIQNSIKLSLVFLVLQLLMYSKVSANNSRPTNCGGLLTLRETQKLIYQETRPHDIQQSCVWFIVARRGGAIKLQLLEDSGVNFLASESTLIVDPAHNKTSSNSANITYSTSYTIVSSKITLIFVTKAGSSRNNGFHLKLEDTGISTVDRNEVTYNTISAHGWSSDTYEYPVSDEDYPNNALHFISIEPSPIGKTFSLKMESLNTEDGPDKLILAHLDTRIMEIIYDCSLTGSLQSKSSSVSSGEENIYFLLFSSDGSVRGKGFKFSYKYEDVDRVQLEGRSINSINSKPRNCQQISKPKFREPHHVIYPFGPQGSGIPVQCDFETDGGGWTIIQSRLLPVSIENEFNKTWKEYEDGFGDIIGGRNYWIGLRIIHALTTTDNKLNKHQKLRIEIGDLDGNKTYEEYNYFKISSVNDFYRIWVDGPSGNAGDSISDLSKPLQFVQNRMKFSTPDNCDNKHMGCTCAKMYSSGWWFNNCGLSNLNGIYNQSLNNGGVQWASWKPLEHLQTTEMKIRDAI